MRLYLDTEFTALNQQASLISLALIDQNGRSFYAELADTALPDDDWMQDNVIRHLQWAGRDTHPFLHNTGDSWQAYLPATELANALRDWLSAYPQAEVWADCVVWDWLLFCELFGGAFEKPEQLYYLPFDLVTLLRARNINPDISRSELAARLGVPAARNLHHALDDATQTKGITEALLNDPNACIR